MTVYTVYTISKCIRYTVINLIFMFFIYVIPILYMSICMVDCRLPGLESSSHNKGEEDKMYDAMLTELLHTFVISPLQYYYSSASDTFTMTPTTVATTHTTNTTTSGTHTLSPCIHISTDKDIQHTSHWKRVTPDRGETDTEASRLMLGQQGDGRSELWRNIFNWRAFTRKNRHLVCLDYM